MAKKNSTKDEEQTSDGGFSKKWDKLLSSEWKDTAQSYSTEEIKKKIVSWEQAISTTEKDMDNDPKLKGLKDRMADLKEEIKEVSEVYTQTCQETMAQIKYVIWVSNQRGTELS